MMEMNIVSTMHWDGYQLYGERFLKSMSDHVPATIQLDIYSQDFKSKPDYYRWSNTDYDVVNNHGVNEFRKYNETIKAQDSIGEYDYRFDAVKFSHKVFCLDYHFHQCRADLMFWIDADVVALREIPQALFESFFQDGELLCYLGREHMHSECGFMGFNLKHPLIAKFFSIYSGYYRDGTLFDLAEHHDSYVFDVALQAIITEHPEVKVFNISESCPASWHPFVNSILGNYFDHLKGPERKEAGESFDSDYKTREKPIA